MSKTLYIKSDIMFYLNLVSWECINAFVMVRVFLNKLVTELYGSSFIVSNHALYIHTRAPELSAKDRMCSPGTNCCMKRYIYVTDTSNYCRLIMKILWNSGWIYHHHARPLSMYPLIAYQYASEHSVTICAVKSMLFIGPPFNVTHWRNLIQIWISCLFQY